MNKTLGLISFSALVSLMNTVPAEAAQPTEADFQVLKDHWQECHYQQDMPSTAEGILERHANFWDEGPLPDVDDHFDLYIQAIAAVDCPPEEAESSSNE